MKILWVKSDFLHPTTRGGQIRTLEMLRLLHRWHEVHYVCLDDGTHREGQARCGEYCSRAYPIGHSVPPRGSIRFAGQLAAGLFSSLPVSVSRYRSKAMRRKLKELLAVEQFDSVVCDFVFPAPNIPRLADAILFQHNVESVIWRRHAQRARIAIARRYLELQAERMERYEREVCRAARHVIAVSEVDRELIRSKYGVPEVSAVGTGVNIPYFDPPPRTEWKADLVFTGSMDWLPNVDGIRFFAEQILPSILKARPECRVAVVGRRPTDEIRQLARRHPNIVVTGTVDDVRPWLWGSSAAIVPLRIGSGTRLKIFEAMAAKIPVLATTVAAEGLPVENGRHLAIEDDPQRFAEACLRLLTDTNTRDHFAAEAWSLVASRFSWEAVTREFESVLLAQSARSRLPRIVCA
jgi:polysaccharide biosynthesis protein PslH